MHEFSAFYLQFYLKALLLLFVVNSGVVCAVVKMNSVSVAT